jgi:transposase
MPSEPEPQPEPRLKPVNRKQLLLRTVDVEKLVEPDHRVRAIWELVGQLDLTGFTADIGLVEGVAGRPSFDPRLLISLWAYAYSEGVSSAHEVERRRSYHPAYQWLTGCDVINYHTLSDFRVQHQGALDELFAQLLGVLSSEGLISLERVMHDGTKVKAAAGGHSFHRQKTLRAHLEAARANYRLRAPVAEFTNAGLKAKIGLRQFCVRGLKKVRCEVLWASLTYNIQQWFRLRWKARLIPARA